MRLRKDKNSDLNMSRILFINLKIYSINLRDFFIPWGKVAYLVVVVLLFLDV